MANTAREIQLIAAENLEKMSNLFLLVLRISIILQVFLLIGLLLIPGKEALVGVLGGIFMIEIFKFVIRRIRTNFERDREGILNEL